MSKWQPERHSGSGREKSQSDSELARVASPEQPSKPDPPGLRSTGSLYFERRPLAQTHRHGRQKGHSLPLPSVCKIFANFAADLIENERCPFGPKGHIEDFPRTRANHHSYRNRHTDIIVRMILILAIMIPCHRNVSFLAPGLHLESPSHTPTGGQTADLTPTFKRNGSGSPARNGTCG